MIRNDHRAFIRPLIIYITAIVLLLFVGTAWASNTMTKTEYCDRVTKLAELTVSLREIGKPIYQIQDFTYTRKLRVPAGKGFHNTLVKFVYESSDKNIAKTLYKECVNMYFK